jgi:hypothetical protein
MAHVKLSSAARQITAFRVQQLAHAAAIKTCERLRLLVAGALHTLATFHGNNIEATAKNVPKH